MLAAAKRRVVEGAALVTSEYEQGFLGDAGGVESIADTTNRLVDCHRHRGELQLTTF
jgi:hypothetical protein